MALVASPAGNGRPRCPRHARTRPRVAKYSIRIAWHHGASGFLAPERPRPVAHLAGREDPDLAVPLITPCNQPSCGSREISADMRASLGLLGIRQPRAEQGDLCCHAHGRHGCSVPVVPKRGRLASGRLTKRGGTGHQPWAHRPARLGYWRPPGRAAAASRSPRGGSSGWGRSGWARLSRGMQPPAPADLTRR